MAIVTLNLAEVNQKTDDRPQACSHCRGNLLQGWGTVRKPVRDTQLKEAEVRRVRSLPAPSAGIRVPRVDSFYASVKG